MLKLLLLLFASSSFAAEGWDYSLPSSNAQAANAWIKGAPGFGKQLKEVDWKWADIEAKEGSYDWSGMKKSIAEVGKTKDGVELHIKGAVYEIVQDGKLKSGSGPKWLKTKYKVPLIKEKAMSGDKTFQITNYDISNASYHDKFLSMLDSLAKSGIPQMPEIAVVYIHNKSRSRGEEGNLTKAEVPLFNKRLDKWAEVFKGNVGKLVYVGSGDGAVDHAFELGMGQRSGFVEDYLAGSNNEKLCQSLDKDGYLVAHEGCQLFDGRASGDENEEYGKQWTNRFGSQNGFAHRYHESMLRVLEMRRTFLWTGNFHLDDPLLKYVSLELGLTIETAPDAWTYLRESYTTKGPIKNFERWLYQRGDSTPAHKVVIDRVLGDRDPKKPYDYIARQSQARLSFALDDKFMFGTKPADIKVTYWDTDKEPWTVDVPGCGSTSVKNMGDGKVKTETIHCPSAKFNGSGMEEDFAILGKPTISFVRVIKL